MTKSEHLGLIGTTAPQKMAPVLYISNGFAPRHKMFPGALSRGGLELVQRTPRRKVMGRRGREVLAEGRILDGAFLGVAMGVAALLWWSTL